MISVNCKSVLVEYVDVQLFSYFSGWKKMLHLGLKIKLQNFSLASLYKTKTVSNLILVMFQFIFLV